MDPGDPFKPGEVCFLRKNPMAIAQVILTLRFFQRNFSSYYCGSALMKENMQITSLTDGNSQGPKTHS